MNILKTISRGIGIINDITQVAISLGAKQRPDFSSLAGTLYIILTIDFKVKPGNATPQKIAAILDDVAALFLS